ncbi:dihydrofolate reductase family protein [Streptomyces sp. NPDC001739]|uniref:Dihydrofolate reductase family protein n=1 Tax=Streptomyces siderophoricus TaxID=2802281 RepID=A0ABS1N0R2_9ACTN|nr:dihydrofolate reductase family protein [Streptomyces sp. 9-7]MBL1093632.1 dihydrofolate reductase family protein [Streptomyces sp. 9-7]
MRKVIASLYITLDGVVENPAWTAPFFDEEAAAFARGQLFAADALLLGRVTYQGFAAAWPTMTDEDGFAERMNALPKYVATTTLDTPEWNATFLTGDLPAAVAGLKQQDGQDLLVYGSGGLVNTLLAHDLIDELRLWTHPVVEGTGKRLFTEDSPKKTLRPLGTTTFRSGAQILTYAPATAPASAR